MGIGFIYGIILGGDRWKKQRPDGRRRLLGFVQKHVCEIFVTIVVNGKGFQKACVIIVVRGKPKRKEKNMQNRIYNAQDYIPLSEMNADINNAVNLRLADEYEKRTGGLSTKVLKVQKSPSGEDELVLVNGRKLSSAADGLYRYKLTPEQAKENRQPKVTQNFVIKEKSDTKGTVRHKLKIENEGGEHLSLAEEQWYKEYMAQPPQKPDEPAKKLPEEAVKMDESSVEDLYRVTRTMAGQEGYHTPKENVEKAARYIADNRYAIEERAIGSGVPPAMVGAVLFTMEVGKKEGELPVDTNFFKSMYNKLYHADISWDEPLIEQYLATPLGKVDIATMFLVAEADRRGYALLDLSPDQKRDLLASYNRFNKYQDVLGQASYGYLKVMDKYFLSLQGQSEEKALLEKQTESTYAKERQQYEKQLAQYNQNEEKKANIERKMNAGASYNGMKMPTESFVPYRYVFGSK